MSIPHTVLNDYGRILSDAAADIHRMNVEAGWYTNIETGERLNRNVPEMLMLIVSEVSEAMEGYRKSLMDDKLPDLTMMEVELADVLIRVFDLCGYMTSVHSPAKFRTDIGTAFVEKLIFNQTRADHKIENRLGDNGKKF